MAKTVLVASNNAHKLQELREILELVGASGAHKVIQLLTPGELGIDLDPDETASTYLGNAQIKARAFVRALQDVRGLRIFPEKIEEAKDLGDVYVLADDSGLEVDALGGRPGIHSSRYHKDAPDGDGCAALLREMSAVPDDQRHARFRCVIVLMAPDGNEHIFEGECEGRVAHEKRGLNGFGFDPVFLVADDPYSHTMAELSSDEKHCVSHRGLAARKAFEFLCGL
jgi:XTP/dITP diphosphohydrolase